MALNSIQPWSINTGVVDRQASPGRPSGPGERLVVPGRPAAEANRPDRSPGRVPIPGRVEDDLAEQIDHSLEGDLDYRVIQEVLAKDPVDQGPPPVAPEVLPPPQAGPDASTEVDVAVGVEVQAPPGAQVDVSVEVDVKIVVGEGGRMRAVPREPPPPPPETQDPLVLDLDGDGIETTGLSRGARFDLNGDGVAERMSNVTGGDALLALDRDGSGRIEGGTELFGDQRGAAHGFAELANLDDNQDGVVDSRDPGYHNLRLLTIDMNGDQSLRGLAEVGISALYLSYQSPGAALANGDVVAQQGTFERADGSTGEMSDVLLSVDRRA